MLAQMAYLLVVVLCVLPLCAIWFHIDFSTCIGALVIVFLLGILGLSIVGTLFAMITLHTRAREVMLPMLFLPVSVPLTIASVYATAQLIAGMTLRDISDYLVLLGVFDIIFFTLVWLIFDFIVEE
jgi:heme exporter protein B